MKTKAGEKLQKSGSRSVYLSERDMQILRQSGGPDSGLSQRISDIIQRYSSMMESHDKKIRNRFGRSDLACLAVIIRENHIEAGQINSTLPQLILNETALCKEFEVDPIELSDRVTELPFPQKCALMELADTNAYYEEAQGFLQSRSDATTEGD